MKEFFPSKEDAHNVTTDKGGPKQHFEGSAAKGKKIDAGDDAYKQETEFGNKK